MDAHELKTWEDPFNDIWHNRKRHEIRKPDRDFKVWDRLYLREYNNTLKSYTGRWMEVEVTYMTKPGEWGIPNNICILSIQVLERHNRPDDEPWKERATLPP